MKHLTLRRFWTCYKQLPTEIQRLADRNYLLLKKDPKHPSLHFKKIGGDSGLWSVRVGINYRALGRETSDGIVWFWIGTHSDDDKLLHQ